jgi:filamentous hemagglutinin
VGITSDFEARELAHLAGNNASGISFQIERIQGLGNLSYEDAFSAEQTLIDEYGLSKNGGTLLNLRNNVDILKYPETYINMQFRGQELLKSAGYPLSSP